MGGVRTRDLKPNEKLRMVYNRMNQCTTDQNHVSYSRYGGKGIYIDRNDWPTSTEFVAWAWESGYVADAGLSIDRIDNKGPYCKANCRWVDRKTQQRNMSSNRYFPYQGEELTAGEILERHQGVYTHQERNRLTYRLKKGWSIEEALTLDKQANGDYRWKSHKRRSAGRATKQYVHEDGQSYTASTLLELLHGAYTPAMYAAFFRRVAKGWPPTLAASTTKLTSRYDKRNAGKQPATEYLA